MWILITFCHLFPVRLSQRRKAVTAFSSLPAVTTSTRGETLMTWAALWAEVLAKTLLTFGLKEKMRWNLLLWDMHLLG